MRHQNPSNTDTEDKLPWLRLEDTPQVQVTWDVLGWLAMHTCVRQSSQSIILLLFLTLA